MKTVNAIAIGILLTAFARDASAEDTTRPASQLKPIPAPAGHIVIPQIAIQGIPEAIKRPPDTESPKSQKADSSAVQSVPSNPLAATPTKAQEEYARKYTETVDLVEKKYPDLTTQPSKMSDKLDLIIREARVHEEPELKDPACLMKYADELAKDMYYKGIKVTVCIDGKTAPMAPGHGLPDNAISQETLAANEKAAALASQVQALQKQNAALVAEAKRQQAIVTATPKVSNVPLAELQKLQTKVEPPKPDYNYPKRSSGNPVLDDFLERVRIGEAGVDPKLQTRARSGDPQAIAEMNKLFANRDINIRLRAGSMTASEAATEHAATEAEYQRSLNAIDQQQIIQELRQQNGELSRLRLEMESRKYR